jgi:carboxypeptidase Taq
MAELRERIAEVSDLSQAAAVLGWDQETMMPPKGAQFRATQQAALAGVIHERFTNPRVGELLTALEAPDARAQLSDLDQAILRVNRRDYDRATKLPASLVRDLAIATTQGVETWRRAREASRFDRFAPDLRRIVELKREEARHVGIGETPYDALLDEYEPGMTSRQLQPIFASLRQETVALLDKINRSGNPADQAVLQQEYAPPAQLEFTRVVLRQMGFDFGAGRQDLSTHPFTTNFGPTDVRLTTRVDAHNLAMALYGSIHEGGHGLYEQGIPLELARTGLGNGSSLGTHESQSRLWENFIGRSRMFWTWALPILREEFPSQLENATPELMTRAVNHVERSLIRTEADEVTYNLHIILRFEIERRLIDGEIQVDELPSIWNELMRQYLGLTPPNDRLGVLQDTHWASGLIGYFPTYSLGNIYAAQLWDALHRDIPDLDARIARGEFDPVLDWLRQHIFNYGRSLDGATIIELASGEPPNAKYLVAYLNRKYGELYGF